MLEGALEPAMSFQTDESVVRFVTKVRHSPQIVHAALLQDDHKLATIEVDLSRESISVVQTAEMQSTPPLSYFRSVTQGSAGAAPEQP
jgi:hypothetical protein